MSDADSDDTSHTWTDDIHVYCSLVKYIVLNTNSIK